MEIINLTPHSINIMLGEESIILPPSGKVARCKEVSQQVGTLENKVPIVKKVFGEVYDLPDPQEGVIYVVSALVAQAAKRNDVLCPGDPVRDAEGKIVGCQSLCKVI